MVSPQRREPARSAADGLPAPAIEPADDGSASDDPPSTQRRDALADGGTYSFVSQRARRGKERATPLPPERQPPSSAQGRAPAPLSDDEVTLPSRRPTEVALLLAEDRASARIADDEVTPPSRRPAELAWALAEEQTSPRIDDDEVTPPSRRPADLAVFERLVHAGATPADQTLTSAPVTALDHDAGELLANRFELLRPIFRGDVCTVWEAVEQPSGRRVAVKLLRVQGSETAAARHLLEEARMLAGLKHRCIARLVEQGETPRTGPFLVLEHLSGPTFADLVRQRPEGMSHVQAMRLLLPIASALCAVHARGIVHRDVKPANIVLDFVPGHPKTPKLIDFGTALCPDPPPLLDPLRVPGGRESFAAEPVLRDWTLDEQVDVWGLAMTLFEMLHGAPAFPGSTLDQMAASLRSPRPLTPTSLAEREPELWQILARAVSAGEGARIATVSSLGRKLARWALARGVTEDVMGRSLALQWTPAG